MHQEGSWYSNVKLMLACITSVNIVLNELTMLLTTTDLDRLQMSRHCWAITIVNNSDPKRIVENASKEQICEVLVIVVNNACWKKHQRGGFNAPKSHNKSPHLFCNIKLSQEMWFDATTHNLFSTTHSQMHNRMYQLWGWCLNWISMNENQSKCKSSL